MPDIDADLARGLRLLEQAPLGKLVEGIGTAIAEAQYNMDRFVIKTLELLDNNDENGVQLPDEVGQAFHAGAGLHAKLLSLPRSHHHRQGRLQRHEGGGIQGWRRLGVATPVSFSYR